MFYTYILISKNKKKTYTGCTKDLDQRIRDHNAGKVESSKPYLPYEMLHVEEYGTLVEARSQERFYKSTSGRRKIKNMILRKIEGEPAESRGLYKGGGTGEASPEIFSKKKFLERCLSG